MRMLLATVAVMAMAAGAAAQPSDTSLPRFMEGCWGAPHSDGTLYEVWMRPSPSLMFGYGVHVRRDDATGFWEQLRIELDANGPVLVAMPNGGPAVRFAAANRAEDEIVFENPNHDSPKSIGYRRVDRRTLRVTLGDGDGAPYSFDLTRAACPH